jgi:hypothetical protein
MKTPHSRLSAASPHAERLRTQLRGTFPRKRRDASALVLAPQQPRGGPSPNVNVDGLKRADLWEPVSGFEPLTCRLQGGCSAC